GPPAPPAPPRAHAGRAGAATVRRATAQGRGPDDPPVPGRNEAADRGARPRGQGVVPAAWGSAPATTMPAPTPPRGRIGLPAVRGRPRMHRPVGPVTSRGDRRRRRLSRRAR